MSVSDLDHWRANPLGFVETVLHDPENGQPFTLLPGERQFLKLAWQLDDDGRLLYPEQIFGAPKKSGKTTLASIHVLTTTLLYGGPYAEATIVANDYEQARSRVFEMCRRIVECSPLLARDARITADKITFPGLKATLQAIGSDYASAAGGSQVVSSFDELWGYVSERSRRLWDELVPPPTRKVALRLTVTYAGFVGESALLEELYKRGLQQPQIGEHLYAGNGILMFWSHSPIAPWQTERWLQDMRLALRPNQYLRMIENRFVTSESTFIDMDQWDACVNTDLAPVLRQQSLQVCVGVDASVRHDSTAIVAVNWNGTIAKLIWHRVFQPSPEEPLDFEATIENTLLDLRDRFQVTKVLFDPYQLMAVSQRLTRQGVPMEEYHQTPANLTTASQNLYELVQSRSLMVYRDAAMRLAISRAVAKETPRGWKIAKEKASHKIDIVVALAMAAHGAMQDKHSTYDWNNLDALTEWLGGDPRAWRAQQYWGRFPI
jgi:phage terminase large subunit-like protein